MTKATLRMSLLEHLSHLISESLHGGFWKIAALGARGAFLLSVLPRLPEGELALYVFISASSLLGSRTMLLGLEDEVPLAVRGECERAAPLTLLVMLGWIGALCAGLLLAAYPIVPLAVAMMSLSLASGLLVGGLARTISPAAFEQMMNLPWLLFAALALLPSIDSALELAVLMSACSILIQIVLTTRLQLLHLPSLESIGMVAGSLRASLTTSWVKLVSNLSILGAMRAFVLWPKVIVMLPLLDSIAFTIAWGEAFWQL